MYLEALMQRLELSGGKNQFIWCERVRASAQQPDCAVN